jgi:Putative adhesin
MTTTNDGAGVVMEHGISARGRLTIRLATAEIRLLPSADGRVVVGTPEGRSLPDRVIFETTDDSLTIREKAAFGVSLGRGGRTIQLEIAVPPAAEVTIETASGWLDAQGLVGEQRYRTASGEIRLRDGAGRIDLTSVSGDARIELADIADLAIKTVSGDVEVDGGRLGTLRLQTTSGDVRVDSPIVGRTGHSIETLSGDVELVAGLGIRVEARTVSGDLVTSLPHRSEGRMGRRSMIVGDGAIELAFRSVSGDLRIRDAAGSGAMPTPPSPPDAPRPPEPPAFSLPSAQSGWDEAADDEATDDEAPEDGDEAERMVILRALERGELDVATAMDRLSALDAATGREAARG